MKAIMVMYDSLNRHLLAAIWVSVDTNREFSAAGRTYGSL